MIVKVRLSIRALDRTRESEKMVMMRDPLEVCVCDV